MASLPSAKLRKTTWALAAAGEATATSAATSTI
jgi:hypothetical protein